ncbi:LysR family transcriptional regulator [Ramlibacter tataouinensis]|uniref:LysR family transcriptional regulator n=1 Tax=Ramlibacter tataouinensis TaxID=94132 RepID=A0A127JZP6_9BURK|nr:LysR family transcriptional regulator [Ramlibacter tataouinensis]AMO25436.1 LysR family transcriptional regulator [Ramlibacter tataouinensis]
MNLSTKQLRAFTALADERHFTRAAALCHLSQPAFTALIQQLETALKVRLFDRSTRSVALTPEGKEFEESVRRILADVDAALAGVSDHALRKRGRVAIALLPSLAADWLPQVLASFHRENPGIEMQVYDVLSEPCIEGVRSGRVDFALAATRVDTPELRAELFCSDTFHLVCPKGHPLGDLPTVRPKDITGYSFIHLSRTSSVRQYVDAATHPATFPAILEVDQLATVSGLVKAGLGISIVPGLALYQFHGPELETRPIQWPGLVRKIHLVRRRDRGFSVAAQALYDWLVANPPVAARPTRPRATKSRPSA